MKLLRISLGFFGPLTMSLAIAGVGCVNHEPDSADDATNEATAAEKTTTELAANDDHRGHGRPMMGPEGLVMTSLHEVDLTNRQRATIETLMTELDPGKAGADKGPTKELTALAAAVRKGSVDASALAPSTADMATHQTDHRARVVSAIQKLHDTLTAEQRTQLVAAVEKRMADGPPGADGPHPDHAGKKGAMGPLGFMLHDVELTAEQRTQLDAALTKANLDMAPPADMKARFEEMKNKAEASLDAFAKERFSAADALPADGPGFGHGPMPKMAEMMAIVVPILTESQRSAVADRLEAGPQRGMGCDHPAAAADQDTDD